MSWKLITEVFPLLLQGRGKTTLLSVLRNPGAPLPENVSTVGVNVAEWVIPGTSLPPKKRGSATPQQLRVSGLGSRKRPNKAPESWHASSSWQALLMKR